MTPLEALRTARKWGIQVVLRDGYYDTYHRWEEPPQWVWRGLSRNSDAIVALLTPDASGRTPEEWELYFEERAAILEYDQHMPRPEAEKRAREQTNAERSFLIQQCLAARLRKAGGVVSG